MTTAILLNIPGTPRPQPRPRLCRGRVVSTADANARRWQDEVRKGARVAFDAHGAMAGPLVVSMMFAMPTKDKARHGLPHTFVPDVDNLAKLALDVVVKAGLIPDDRAVSTIVVRKTWAEVAGMVMTIAADDRQVRVPAEPEAPPRWLN